MEATLDAFGPTVNGSFNGFTSDQKWSVEVGSGLQRSKTQGHVQNRVRVVQQVLCQTVWECWRASGQLTVPPNHAPGKALVEEALAEPRLCRGRETLGKLLDRLSHL